jgi:hypothetical protein
MSRTRVFADTGALLAMVVFPRDRAGELTLAGEVLQLYEDSFFDLAIGQAVIDELDEVLDERFPRHRYEAVQWLAPFAGHLVRWPSPREMAAVLPFSTDPADAPIFASAVIAEPGIVLSNDFHALHTPLAKAFWEEHGIVVEGLYGLLCVFHQRRHKGEN